MSTGEQGEATARGIPWRRILLVLVLCGAVALVATSDALHGSLARLLAVTERMIGTVILGESFLHRQVLPSVVLGLIAVLFSAWAFTRLNRRLASAHTRT